MRLITIIMLFILSSCSHKGQPSAFEALPPPHSEPVRSVDQDPTERDGAPATPKQVSDKPVNPVSEPLSRYGNWSSYRVKGKTYHVMTSAEGYQARGLASWYGTKFHKKRTSSGEDYDLYELTAAHKTLPLPTYVTVKNLKNGREVTVKVNDRGPFHEDRIIDLSYGAATKLGMLPTGTALVEIKAITSHAPSGQTAQYYLQAGAFSVEKFARVFRDQLAGLTASPVFVEKYQDYFIVKAGPFADKQGTDRFKKTLAQHGISGVFSLLQ